ncbi:MAG: hypothetical protein VX589_03625 [Myxococcota bacterium]|nr:hypothetical protein [Myxococcota bacterium]
MMARFSVIGLVLYALFLLGAMPSFGKDRFATVGAVEYWGDPQTPYHGFVLVAWTRELGRDLGRTTLEYNTDTLRLELDGLKLTSTLELGSRLTGEYGQASLLMDYFKDGVGQPARGVWSSFILGQVWLKHNPAKHLYFHVEMGGRKWFFEPAKNTSNALTLPSESWVFEPRLYVTWWGLDNDEGWWQRHRVYPRIAGFAMGLYGGINILSERRQWGALDATVFVEPDLRNDPDRVQYFLVHWTKFGAKLGGRARLEIQEESGFYVGEDDVYRRTIGGLNPYVITLPGVPWAYFHSGDYTSATMGLPVRTWNDVEIGPLISGGYFRDVQRDGDRGFGGVWGIGASVDARFGRWQMYLRGGYCPTIDTLNTGRDGWSILLGNGWGQ